MAQGFEICRVSSCSLVLLQTAIISTARKQDGDDDTVQRKGFADEECEGAKKSKEKQETPEDEDEHHGDVHSGLLASCTNTSITSDADGNARAHSSKTDGQTRAEIHERADERVVGVVVIGDWE